MCAISHHYLISDSFIRFFSAGFAECNNKNNIIPIPTFSNLVINELLLNGKRKWGLEQRGVGLNQSVLFKMLFRDLHKVR